MTVTKFGFLDTESLAYPFYIPDGCGSALLLFCSGRMGAADGHWVREAGLTDVTCVDWDAATLEPFASEYPSEWTYVKADVFDFVTGQERTWDLVSADAPSQLAPLLADSLPRYCALANRYVTATVSSSRGDLALTDPEVFAVVPAGWRMTSLIPRNLYRGVHFYWLVLERA